MEISLFFIQFTITGLILSLLALIFRLMPKIQLLLFFDHFLVTYWIILPLFIVNLPYITVHKDFLFTFITIKIKKKYSKKKKGSAPSY